MKYKKKMKPKWSNIHIVQDKLEKRLKKEDKGYIDNIKMVAGELLENSVKYYMKYNIKKPVDFVFEKDKEITISIKNQWVKDDDILSLIKVIARINESINPYNLFLERLQEILDNRIKGESKLGLLRIASEGGFSLSYEYNNERLSIYAKKRIKKEEQSMMPLNYEDLKIEVTDFEKYVKVSWIGKCRTLNPENVLDTYLAQLTQFVKSRKVYIVFDELESMNSSTVPPLLTFIKTLEENCTESIFLYNDNEDWQRASFKPLSVIAGKYQYVKIKPSSNFELV